MAVSALRRGYGLLELRVTCIVHRHPSIQIPLSGPVGFTPAIIHAPWPAH